MPERQLVLRTLELGREARLAAEERDLRVVALVHERAEHGACRRAVAVAHCIQVSDCLRRDVFEQRRTNRDFAECECVRM